MPEPGSTQKKPATAGTFVKDAAADPIEFSSNPESPPVKGDQAKGDQAKDDQAKDDPALPRELGGPAGPEPTRYGDWERKGRCIDF